MLNPFFSPPRVALLEPAVRSYAAELARRLAAKGECDVFAEFAAPIPVFALSTFFSLPADQHEAFQRLTHRVLHETAKDLESSLRAAQELFGMLAVLLEERKATPREGDLLSDIASGLVNGHPIDEFDALDTCMVVVLGGIDTVQNGIANAIRLLGRRPDLRRRLREEPGLFTSAVEELLRFDGPVQSTARTVATACSFAGQELEKGDSLLLVWAAGNRDPEEFPDPDEVVFDREPNRHLAFGSGIHRCLGAHLARLELRLALEEFLRWIPDYEVTDDLEDPEKWVTGIIRGPKTLPIRYPPAGRAPTP
jgi:cytochrome P450